MNKKPYLSLQLKVVVCEEQDVVRTSYVEVFEGADDNTKTWGEVFGQ